MAAPLDWAALSLKPASALLRDNGPSGRLSDLVGWVSVVQESTHGARLTWAMHLIWEAQRLQEPVAWIGVPGRTFYPPDAIANGVDPDALPVIQVSDGTQQLRAADHLLRSGAFGLIVIDGAPDCHLSNRVLSRLGPLARRHVTAVVCLVSAHARVDAAIDIRSQIEQLRLKDGRYRCRWRSLKDRRRAPGAESVEVVHGPIGLC